jgi:hypothetical protein
LPKPRTWNCDATEAGKGFLEFAGVPDALVDASATSPWPASVEPTVTNEIFLTFCNMRSSWLYLK